MRMASRLLERSRRNFALMDETVNHMKIWIPVAILVIVLLAFAGLLPLPGQKDNVTPSTQPGSPQVEAPKGPPEAPQTPPGGAR